MRPIDADALVEAIKDYPYGFRGMIVCDIAKQPTIEPKDGCEYWDGESGFCALHRPADPVKHGKWIELSEAEYKCSACGSWYGGEYGDEVPTEYAFCPRCGAVMERSEE